MAISSRKAAVVSARLCILFLLVYAGCNWITTQRVNVTTFYFEWERHIPFVPLFILPYLSIDLFFIAAPFLCRTEEELRIFSRRVATAIIAAGVCFLIFPLRFAFPRPRASGWTGALFDWFRALDAPHNLVPSLHATLWLFLLDLYWRHTHGIARLAAVSWLALVGLSPLLTHQHHFIDIVTGLALGGACFYFIGDRRFSSPPKFVDRNNRASVSRL